jgi:hypothetical protein
MRAPAWLSDDATARRFLEEECLFIRCLMAGALPELHDVEMLVRRTIAIYSADPRPQEQVSAACEGTLEVYGRVISKWYEVRDDADASISLYLQYSFNLNNPGEAFQLHLPNVPWRDLLGWSDVAKIYLLQRCGGEPEALEAFLTYSLGRCLFEWYWLDRGSDKVLKSVSKAAWALSMRQRDPALADHLGLHEEGLYKHLQTALAAHPERKKLMYAMGIGQEEKAEWVATQNLKLLELVAPLPHPAKSAASYLGWGMDSYFNKVLSNKAIDAARIEERRGFSPERIQQFEDDLNSEDGFPVEASFPDGGPGPEERLLEQEQESHRRHSASEELERHAKSYLHRLVLRVALGVITKEEAVSRIMETRKGLSRKAADARFRNAKTRLLKRPK